MRTGLVAGVLLLAFGIPVVRGEESDATSNLRTGVSDRFALDETTLPDGSTLAINIGNGNLILSTPLSGFDRYRGRPVTSRVLNSYETGSVDSFGEGWVSFGSIRLEAGASNTWTLHGYSGLTGAFVPRADGSFESPPGMPAVLRQNGDGTLTLRWQDTMETWTFGPGVDHRLVRAVDITGYAIDASYASNGVLSTLTASDGATAIYSHGGDALVDEIDMPPGSGQHTFSWERAGSGQRLAWFEDHQGRRTTYTYDAAGKLIDVGIAGAGGAEIAYQLDGRVASVTTRDASDAVTERTTFERISGSWAADSTRDGQRIASFFGDGSLVPELERSSSGATPEISLSGRVAGGLTQPLTAGSHDLVYALSGSETAPGIREGIARAELTVDGVRERLETWDCATDCPSSQSGRWTMNTGAFAAGEHVARLAVRDASGKWTAKTVRFVVPHSAQPLPPRTRVQPTVVGTAAEGETLTVRTSHWAGDQPIQFLPQWLRCSAEGLYCKALLGETDWSYTVTSADAGATIIARINARNAAGGSFPQSAPVGPVASSRPATTETPRIIGRVATGSDVAVDGVRWTGARPIDFTFQWESCSTPNDCTEIAGATEPQFEVPPSITALRVSVTATNAIGSATVASQLYEVASTAAVPSGEIRVWGVARVGKTLIGEIPTWTPALPVRAVEWVRCDAATGEQCRPIAGASSERYLLGFDDLGHRLRLRVTWNDAGRDIVDESAATEIIGGSLINPRRAAYVLNNEELWTIGLDGSDRRKLLTVDASDRIGDIAVSPDGDTIALLTCHGIVTIDGRGRKQRHPLELYCPDNFTWPYSIAFSPTGDSLVMHATTFQVASYALYSVDLDDGSRTRLDSGWTSRAPYNHRSQPSFTPDGNYLTYILSDSGINERAAIGIADVDSFDETVIPIDHLIDVRSLMAWPSLTTPPQMSEDQRTILFSARPLASACGNALFAVDVETHAVRQVSSTTDCGSSLLRPSWIGPDSNVLIASANDLSRDRAPTRIEQIDLATGVRTPILSSTDAPITALELPQTSVPFVNVDTPSGDAYGNGTDPAQLPVSAFDDAVGVQSIAYGPTGAAPTATWQVDCDGLCPDGAEHTFELATSGLPEGVAGTYAVSAQNAAGTVGTTTARLLIDRTRPLPAGDVAVVSSDPGAQTATLAWKLATDPDLPGGEPGAGVARASLRWHTTATGWSDWSAADAAELTISGVASGMTITIESRATDAVGNVATVTSTVDWNPPAPDPDDVIDGIVWGEEGGAGRLAGNVCSGRFVNEEHVPTRLPYRDDLMGERDNGVGGQVEISCPRRATAQRIAVRMCVRARLYPAGTTMRNLWCGTPKSSRSQEGKLWWWIRSFCAPGPAIYEITAEYRRARTNDVWERATSDERQLGCYFDRSWRGAVREENRAVSLSGAMYAANDVPPSNRGGGTTPGTTNNGFRAHRIIPAASRTGRGLQFLAWRCGLGRGEPNLRDLVVNEPWQAVWLRGEALRDVGDNHARKPSSRFAQLSFEGRRRAYWRNATGDTYVEAVTERLGNAVDSSSGICDRSRAVRIMGTIKRDLEDGRVPGFAPPSSEWRRAWAFRPVLRFDSSEVWRPLDVREFTDEYPDASRPGHRFCYTDPLGRSACDPLSQTIRSPLGWSSNYRWVDILHDQRGTSTDYYRSPHPECNRDDDPKLYDCDRGRASTMYFTTSRPFRATGLSSAYRYIDYWMFYRYNHFSTVAEFDHEGDWEGVTVAPSPDGRTFHYAGFSGHGTFYSYLREFLSCEAAAGATTDCGPASTSAARRIAVMVANGSHANYARRCHEQVPYLSCRQNGAGARERGYDGRYLWGNAFAGGPESLQKIPTSSSSSLYTAWGSWPGRWGGQASPDGPLQQSVNVVCARIDNGDGDACADGPRARGTSAPEPAPFDESKQMSPGLVGLSCDSWSGEGVNASLCDQQQLRDAIATGTLDGATVAAENALVAGERTVAAPGVAQSAGAPLEDGDSLRLGLLDQYAEGELVVRVKPAGEDQLFLATFDVADLASSALARGTGAATAELDLGGTAGAVTASLGDVEASRVERDG